MTRRRFLLTSLAAVVGTPLLGEAQQVGKVYRLGWLGLGSQAAAAPLKSVLLDALRERGWNERQIVFEEAFAEGDARRLPSLVRELLSRNVEVIITSGTTAIQAAKDATRTVPIVMMGGGDPVGTGLVQSLAKPGGNVTGISLVGQELSEKTLDLMKQALPSLSVLVLIRQAANPANQFFLNHFEAAGRKLGISVTPLDIRTPEEFASAFTRVKADAGLMLLDPVFYPHRERIADLALKNRLPLVSLGREYAEAGLLFTHGPELTQVVRAVAPYVDKILRGARAGELPIEQPSKLDLVINLKTAKALGLTIPPSLLLRADRVIE